jgi:hypothetical protein
VYAVDIDNLLPPGPGTVLEIGVGIGMVALGLPGGAGASWACASRSTWELPVFNATQSDAAGLSSPRSRSGPDRRRTA